MNNNFHIITSAYNSSKFLEKYFNSIKNQNYNNWYLTFIDDASEDDTVEKICELSKENRDQVSIIQKKKNINNINLLLEGIKNSQSEDDILCFIDSDDELNTSKVFSEINDVYNRSNADCLWTAQTWNYQRKYNMSSFLPPEADPYKFRWVATHLKTCRKKILNLVPPENFCDNDGNPFIWARDMALYLPILYKSKKRIYYPKYFYNYRFNFNTINSPKHKEQLLTEKFLRARGFLN